ncbi:hypothetical protein ACHWQZ_G002880 [Mnemiopsis leidyi]
MENPVCNTMLGDVDCEIRQTVIRGGVHAADPEDVVEFVVEGERLVARRSILTQHCTFFSNMFRPVFRESLAKVIELKNVSLPAMRMFLKLVHLREDPLSNLDVTLVEEEGLNTLLELFTLVDMFQHTPLICALSQVSTNTENCCQILSFVGRYGFQGYALQDPAKCALRVAAANFTLVTQSAHFLELELPVALELLSQDNIEISSECEVLHAAIRWFRYNHLPDIFTAVRQYLIPLKELLKYKKDGAVWNALLFPVAQNSDVPGARQRDALKCLYVIGGLDQRAVEIYNIKKKDWYLGTSLPESRHAACTATLNCTIYIMGGYTKGGHTNTVLGYRIREDKWLPKSSMSLARSGAGAAVLQGRIYVCGGRNVRTVFNSCEVYDPSTDSWSFTSNMNTPRTYHGLAATSDALYCIGGTSAISGIIENSQLKTVERYCPITRIWSLISPLGLPVMAPGCCAVEDTVYVFGGRNLSHTVMSYRYNTSNYTLERPMSVPRGQGVKTVCVGHMIYCIGGCPGFGTLRSMERLDTKTKTWSALPSKSFPQSSTCFTVM